MILKVIFPYLTILSPNRNVKKATIRTIAETTVAHLDILLCLSWIVSDFWFAAI